MANLFNAVVPIDRSQFISQWEMYENKNDPLAIRNLDNHKRQTGQTYFLVDLTELGTQNIVVPYHVHSGVVVASKGGESLWSVVERYSQNHWQDSECQKRIDGIQAKITEEFEKSGSMFPNTVIPFVSNNPELAMPGHYNPNKHNQDTLYAASTHRFIACGLWMREKNLFPVLRIFYCAS